MELLSKRSQLEIAPFVTSWHPRLLEIKAQDWNANQLRDSIFHEIVNSIMPSSPARPRGSSNRSIGSPDDVARIAFDVFVKCVEQAKNRRRSDSSVFEYAFKNAVLSLVAPASDKLFENASLRTVKSLAEHVWIDDRSKVNYLKGLFASIGEQDYLTIATLNYDNTVELAAQADGHDFETSIKRWMSLGQFREPASGIFLIKLHGSLDWVYRATGKPASGMLPRRTIDKIQQSEVRSPKNIPAILFGQRNKLTAEGPFLDLLAAFRKELGKTEDLVVIGYSFRDDHINEYIAQWFNESPTRILRIVDPSFSSLKAKFAREIRSLGPTRVFQYEMPAKDWLLLETQEEHHVTVSGKV